MMKPSHGESSAGRERARGSEGALGCVSIRDVRIVDRPHRRRATSCFPNSHRSQRSARGNRLSRTTAPVIRDMGSKNGTWVNGKRIDRGRKDSACRRPALHRRRVTFHAARCHVPRRSRRPRSPSSRTSSEDDQQIFASRSTHRGYRHAIRRSSSKGGGVPARSSKANRNARRHPRDGRPPARGREERGRDSDPHGSSTWCSTSSPPTGPASS